VCRPDDGASLLDRDAGNAGNEFPTPAPTFIAIRIWGWSMRHWPANGAEAPPPSTQPGRTPGHW
jgi:hypothetical protein